MTSTNIFTRLIKSITDFSFSNQFIKEKTGKTIGLMFFGYLLFVLVFGGVTLVKMAPFVDEMEMVVEDELSKLPDFQMSNGVFNFEDGRTYFEEDFDGLAVIVDLEDKHDVAYYLTQHENYILIKDNNLYMNSNVPTPIEGGTVIDKSMVRNIIKAIVPMMYVGLAIGAVLGIAVMFLMSLGVWGFVLIINSFIKKGLTASECYRVTGHAMVLPGIVLCLAWILPFEIPGMFFIYFGLASLYGYLFMVNYEPETFELEEIYED